MVNQIQVLDVYEDGEKCHFCGSPVWIVDSDGEKCWLLCYDRNNLECNATRAIPECVEVVGYA